MDITVYLPDELGQRARDAQPKLEYSRMLRDAIEAELERRATLAAARDGMAEQRVKTSEGRYSDTGVILRFTGKELAGDGETSVWLLEDGRVVVADEESYSTFDDTEEFADWAADIERRYNLGASAEEVLRQATSELGIIPVIDL